MANLIVRNVDERIVRALKSRAGKHGRSAEAEHRELLAAVLLKSKTKSFAEVLASIPNVGEDADFARIDHAAARESTQSIPAPCRSRFKAIIGRTRKYSR